MILIAIVAGLLALVVKVIDASVVINGGAVVFLLISAWALFRIAQDARFSLWTRRDWWIVTIFAAVMFVRGLFATDSPAGLILLGILCLVLALPTLLVSKLPYRWRLLVECTILVAILAHGAWLRQDPYLAGQSEHAGALSERALAWAAESNRPGAQRVYQTEAAWFARAAYRLRIKAMRVGFLETLLPQDFDWLWEHGPWSDWAWNRRLIYELSVSEGIDAHEVVILQERERESGQSPAQPP
jgi:hypothetical protein